MKTIPLTKGYVAIVDDANYQWLSCWKWCYSGGYAVRRKPGSKNEVIRMHNLIANPKKGLTTDHINRNKLDNRQSNLRNVTHTMNMYNKGLTRNNTSGVKGVGRHRGRWRALLTANGVKHFLGSFDTIEEAIEARVAGELKYIGFTLA